MSCEDEARKQARCLEEPTGVARASVDAGEWCRCFRPRIVAGICSFCQKPRRTLSGMPSEEFQSICEAAVDWQYLTVQEGRMATKSGCEDYLMQRFGLSRGAAHQVANQVERTDSSFVISDGRVQWTNKDRPAPERGVCQNPECRQPLQAGGSCSWSCSQEIWERVLAEAGPEYRDAIEMREKDPDGGLFEDSCLPEEEFWAWTRLGVAAEEQQRWLDMSRFRRQALAVMSGRLEDFAAPAKPAYFDQRVNCCVSLDRAATELRNQAALGEGDTLAMLREAEAAYQAVLAYYEETKTSPLGYDDPVREMGPPYGEYLVERAEWAEVGLAALDGEMAHATVDQAGVSRQTPAGAAPPLAVVGQANKIFDWVDWPQEGFIRGLYEGKTSIPGGDLPDWTQVEETINRALPSYREARDYWGEARALTLLTVAAARKGDLVQAVELCAAALEANREGRLPRDGPAPLPISSELFEVVESAARKVYPGPAGGAKELDRDEALVAAICKSPELAVEFAEQLGYIAIRDRKRTGNVLEAEHIQQEFPALDRFREAACQHIPDPRYRGLNALRFATNVEGPHDRTREVCCEALPTRAWQYAQKVDRGYNSQTWAAVRGTRYEQAYLEEFGDQIAEADRG